MNHIHLEPGIGSLDYAVSEAIKGIRTSILFSGADIKVISVTSCEKDDGKSFLSYQIARELAEIGKRVLFIDADMRNSSFAVNYTDQTDIKGLSHYLSGQCSVGDVLYSTDWEGLYAVISGLYPPNPAELLSSQYFKDFVAEARENFDYVIIDTPPVLVVTDAAICIAAGDGSILVLNSGKTGMKAATEAKIVMESTGKPIIGCVLNKVRLRSKQYKYEYRYGKV